MEALISFLDAADRTMFAIWQMIFRVWFSVWWIVLPVILGIIFWKMWLYYIRTLYLRGIKRILLRVRPPRDILKTPKAMEQIFAAAHGTYSFGLRRYQKYWEGRVEEWTSFEIVANRDGIYFYIWLNEIFRNMIESAVYAQYPDAEIEAVDDYINLWPSVLPNKTYDIFGADLILGRDDAYPIRSYEEFEARVEEEKIDPIAILLEVASKLKAEETIWLQIPARPAGDRTGVDLPKQAEELINKMTGRRKPASPGIWAEAAEFLVNLIRAPFVKELTWGKKEEKPAQEKRLTAAEQDIVKSIINKSSKVYFQTAIRFIYIDRADSFSRANPSALFGSFRHLSSLQLNFLRPNLKMMSFARFPLKKRKLYYKKRRIYDYYRRRWVPKKVSIFNIEELATIYHYPGVAAQAPQLETVEARRGGPPSTLPTT